MADCLAQAAMWYWACSTQWVIKAVFLPADVGKVEDESSENEPVINL